MSLFDELFGWQDMIGNYDERKVARDEVNDYTIDTVLVTDRRWTYETAISHEHFDNGDWIIVEGYDTKEDAIKGHKKWLEKCKIENIVQLTDCYTEQVFVVSRLQ